MQDFFSEVLSFPSQTLHKSLYKQKRDTRLSRCCETRSARRVRFADDSQGLRGQVSQAPSDQVPSALLPEDGDRIARVVAAAPAGVQPDVGVAAKPVYVRHVPPRLAVVHRTLETRDVPAEAGLVVRGLDAPGVLGRDEHESESGGRLLVTDVLRGLGDVRVQLDPPPPQGERLEGLGTREETELVGVGTETFPAPAAVLLTFGCSRDSRT